MSETRRRFLAIVGLAPVAMLGSRQAFAAGACYDLETLPLSQRSLRKSMNFADPSPFANKRCGSCAFFDAGQNGCGSCQILSGGPTAQTAYCTSFAPKPGAK